MGCVNSRKKSFKDVQTVHRLPPPLRSSFFRSNLKKLSKEKNNGKLFSDYEVNLIRESWKQVYNDKEVFCINVYRRIFDCEPELKILFSWQDIETDKLILEPSFISQAVSIVGVIDSCVQSLDNIQDSVESLHSLGKFHTKLRGYGFKPEHWTLFKLSIMFSLASAIKINKNKQELLETWNTLITFVVETMNEGFNDAMKIYLENSNMIRVSK